MVTLCDKFHFELKPKLLAKNNFEIYQLWLVLGSSVGRAYKL